MLLRRGGKQYQHVRQSETMINGVWILILAMKNRYSDGVCFFYIKNSTAHIKSMFCQQPKS